MSKFHWIEDLRFTGAELELVVAEMSQGSPDGLVGRPLVVASAAPRVLIRFRAIGRIEIAPEPVSQPSDTAQKKTAFLFFEPNSPLLQQHSWSATTFNLGERFRAESDLKHYVALAEK